MGLYEFKVDNVDNEWTKMRKATRKAHYKLETFTREYQIELESNGNRLAITYEKQRLGKGVQFLA